ncbi:preprotein translocase subunit SecY [archaeon]|nr:preprotein translocase subunit SecY [archaeon]
MSFIKNILMNLPEVKPPEQKKLPFNTKLKWTITILLAFFVLGLIPLFGLDPNSQFQFEQLALILGAKFGSIISLGIGPIVTASIVLQLLTGSGILKLDLNSHDGKRFFQGLQKTLAIFFIIFEAFIYVFMGGFAPTATLMPSQFFSMQLILVFQLFLGGILILFMDEVISKYGFGSGISLFIAAGVSEAIFIRALSPLTAAGTLAFGSGQAPVGKVWILLRSIAGGNINELLKSFFSIFFTIAIFLMAVYAQAMKVEIPLSFGRVRGYGIRWPLKFIYTSNIPVILIAALLANVQLWARLLESWGRPWLGTFSGNIPATGFVTWINPPQLIENLINGIFTSLDVFHAAVYITFFIIGCIVFSFFWVQTAGMDARSQAKQIMSSGLQIPGFRRDERVLERILKRYITPLTVMGAVAVGLLAASADLLGALTSGTGILLAVMIIYNLYEEIAQQHMMDMHPSLRRMIK